MVWGYPVVYVSRHPVGAAHEPHERKEPRGVLGAVGSPVYESSGFSRFAHVPGSLVVPQERPKKPNRCNVLGHHVSRLSDQYVPLAAHALSVL